MRFMSNDRYYLEIANDFAEKNTTCLKVPVGSLFVDSNGELYFDSNRSNDGYNCIDEGYCYKAHISGIYESTESTRHLCRSIHSEINLLNYLKENKVDITDGTLYVTRYPCENCSKEIVRSGIRHLVYGGRDSISEFSERLFLKAGVSVIHIPDIDRESHSDMTKCDIALKKAGKYWTKSLYDTAYDIVRDRRYPILVPSYNRPNNISFISGIFSRMDESQNNDIYVFVRKSQESDYLNGIAQKNRYVHIVVIDDDRMIGAGAARREGLIWAYNNGIDHAFFLDDDLLDIGFTFPGVTSSGSKKSEYVPKPPLSRVLAMWQLSYETVNSSGIELSLCGISHRRSCWSPECCSREESFLLYRGFPNQAVLINVKRLYESGILYRDNSEVGHEDIALAIDIVQRGEYTGIFPFLEYDIGKMTVENWDFDSLEERFEEKQNRMRSVYGDLEYVKFIEKRGLKQVSIDWKKVREMRGIKKYKFNIADKMEYKISKSHT